MMLFGYGDSRQRQFRPGSPDASAARLRMHTPVAIDIDDSRLEPTGTQHELENAFGRNHIPVRRRQEIDGVSSRLNGLT